MNGTPTAKIEQTAVPGSSYLEVARQQFQHVFEPGVLHRSNVLRIDAVVDVVVVALEKRRRNAWDVGSLQNSRSCR